MSGLILTRRARETIYIGKNVKITVLNFKGNQVRISIDAPKHLAVDRGEVRVRKEDEPDFNPGEVE
jgi:carbon storage regulator